MRSSDKNLLLINPWIYDFTAYDLWSQPLGLLYIASFLRYHGFNIQYIDCLRSEESSREKTAKKYGQGHYRREIVEKPEILSAIPRKYARYGISVEEFKYKLERIPVPDAVLVTSIMTYWYPGPQHVLEIIRARFPGVPVILGGVYASILPEHALKVVKPDLVITGPGEFKVLKSLSDLLALDIQTELPESNLDARPYPAFDLLDNHRYLCLMTARGCPFNCSFCAQKKITMRFQQRSPDNVINELCEHYRRFKIRDFAFYDDALFINKEKHIKVILQGIIRTGLPLRLHTPNGLFAREIDEELAGLMYRANFKTVRLSFETANENRRADMNNKISNQGMRIAVDNLVRAGYNRRDIEAYVIMGLPGQSLQEIMESIIFVNNLGLRVSLSSYSPIPGTLDYERSLKAGYIEKDIDPLLTNKTIFPLKNDELDYETFRKIRIFNQLLNRAAQSEFAPFTDNKLAVTFKKILNDLP
jgi:radical SAM superfamily enzyme YgiQ (UPF0313 family)